jgi:thiol-disulfide isomerase/thioredoxin
MYLNLQINMENRIFLMSLVIILSIFLISGQADNPGNSPNFETPADKGVSQPGSQDFSGEIAPENMDSQTISAKETREVGDYFGLEKNHVKLEGITQDRKVSIERAENRVTVNGQGDFSLSFLDEKGNPSRTYEGFQEREVGENKLVFDKNNQLTEGTEFRSDGGEEKQGRKLEYKGHEVTLNEGDLFKVDKENKEDIAKIRTDEKITPVRNIGKSEEKPRFEFTAEGENVKLQVSEKQEMSVKGKIYYEGEQARYKSGNLLSLGGVEIPEKSFEGQSEWSNIRFNSNEAIPEGYEGTTLTLDKENKILGARSDGSEKSPVMEVSVKNEILDLKSFGDDEIKRNLVIQSGVSKGNGFAEVLIKDNSDKGGILEATFRGEGSRANLDNKGVYISSEKKDLMFRTNGVVIEGLEDAEGSSTFPMEMKFMDENGNLLNDKGFDFYVNAYNQYASIEKSYNFDENKGLYLTDKNFYISPRLTHNYLDLESQKKIALIAETKPEIYDKLVGDKFFELKSGKQREYLDDIRLEEITPERELPPVPELRSSDSESSNSIPQKRDLGKSDISPILPSLGNPDKLNKLTIIKFSTPGCTPCKKMSTAIELLQSQGRVPRDVKIIEIDASKMATGNSQIDGYQLLEKYYGIGSYPGTLMFNSDGKVIDIFGGYLHPDKNAQAQDIAPLLEKRINSVLRKLN